MFSPCVNGNCRLIYYKRAILLICTLSVFLCLVNFAKFRFSYHEKIVKLENYDFKYLITNDICIKKVFLLILIHSAADHFKHRQTIRDTWGNPGEHLPVVKVVFLLAKADDIQRKIFEESERYKDIIQGDFIDSYRNLTYKHAMGLSWSSTYCKEANFILKMDDDIFMDIYQLLTYIQDRLKHFDLSNSIACYHQKSMPVVRDPVSKWYVSESEYSSRTFDDYCSGWAYLTTTRVASHLYKMAQTLPYFWVDDVHMTGTVRKAAGIGLIRLNHLFALETDGLIEWCSTSNNLKWNKVFAPTWGDLSLSRRAYLKSLTCYITNCNCCYFRATTPKPLTSSTTVKGTAQLISLHKKYLHKNKQLNSNQDIFF